MAVAGFDPTLWQRQLLRILPVAQPHHLLVILLFCDGLYRLDAGLQIHAAINLIPAVG